MYYNTTNCVKIMACGIATLDVKTMVCGVAIKSLEITLILQPARSDVKIGSTRSDVKIGPARRDVKIGPARAHRNRLNISTCVRFLKYCKQLHVQLWRPQFKNDWGDQIGWSLRKPFRRFGFLIYSCRVKQKNSSCNACDHYLHELIHTHFECSAPEPIQRPILAQLLLPSFLVQGP